LRNVCVQTNRFFGVLELSEANFHVRLSHSKYLLKILLFFTGENVFTVATPKTTTEWPTVRTSSNQEERRRGKLTAHDRRPINCVVDVTQLVKI